MPRSAFDPSTLPRRWSPDDAEVILTAWQESGLSVAEFARAHGWDPMRLYRWRRELGQTDVAVEPLEFIELEVKGRSSSASLQREPFIVEFGDIRIHVPAQFDAEGLSRLMDAILC